MNEPEKGGKEDRKRIPPKTKTLLLAVFTVIVIVSVGVVVLFVAQVADQSVQDQTEDPDTVYFFYGDGCPHCETVMPLVLRLQKDYPAVNFRILETWKNKTNAEQSDTLMRERERPNSGVPLVIVGQVVLLGDQQIPQYLEGIVTNISIKKSASESNWFTR